MAKRLLVSALSLLVCGPACSYEWHALRRPQDVPQSAPSPRIDRVASEVELKSARGLGFASDEADRVRSALTSAMETLMRPRHPEDHGTARYRMVATLERRGNWSYAYIVVPFVPLLGAPTHRVDAHVELELQIGDQIYRGEGSKRVHAGFYYNWQTRERALTTAFRSALQQAITSAEGGA